jgi:predicted nucleotidyltransferase component of viral defense system
MITKAEIDSKAEAYQIHTSNVQRDYVFGWLLYGFFTASGLKDTLFLKGGNALRKGYFENTRFSYDLDFGIPGGISEKTLRNEINSVCSLAQEKVGVVFVTEDTKVQEKFAATDAPLPDLKVYEARIYFKDFYGKPNSIVLRISMDVTRFDRVLLPCQMVPLIHPYSDSNEVQCTIRCMKLEEIIATKLKCLMQREHAPDLFDYAYSIKLLGGNLNKVEVVSTLIRKTIFERNPVVLKEILASITLGIFREQWAKRIIVARQFFLDVEDAIQSFLGDLEGLFQGYRDNGFGDFIYFRAPLRVPIMQAARTQTLLRIIYKGEERLVEPYSLKYQQRRDGAQIEYFFAYKVSGGESEPGIKRFLPSGMQSITNTDVAFEPRFQIELSKAGELPEDRYLFDPNKPMRVPRRRPRQRSIVYVYECNSCGKRFTRDSRNSKLRPHKDKRGFPCHGRYGIYVDTQYPR